VTIWAWKPLTAKSRKGWPQPPKKRTEQRWTVSGQPVQDVSKERHRKDCWRLTKFWEILGQVLPILGLRRPVEERAQDEAEIAGISAPFWVFFGDLGICNGNGMLAHGFTHV
jgi:hypothetical protein